ncbi:MAG: glucosyltransferase [Solobacterium sp.]|nr:glucosyltransferase [Solobacterium sp.]
MKKIAMFCIPAHGHTNPMLPVAAELVRRGHSVRFYSFDEFAEKIQKTGAQFIRCNDFLPPLNKEEEKGIKNVSSTEMTIQDLRITAAMDSFLKEELTSFQPDVIYTDAVCFWGKLNAMKYQIPMVVSTSTFAFNALSSRYMKNSVGEIMDLILGLGRIKKEMKKLEAYGYQVKNVLSLIQNDNDTDTIVYTTRRFQPYSESFSDHYAFVGPSVFATEMPMKEKERPLVYISMGTVINDRPDFYHKCMEALKDMDADVIISCGRALSVESLGNIPANVRVYPYVDQLSVLARADVFISHCGMNSVSESLYMATPLVLYPQTNEQKAVAKRTAELGAGLLLEDDSAAGIRAAVTKVLQDASFRKGAQEACEDFRQADGRKAAANFIEQAPHPGNGKDLLKELQKKMGLYQLAFWLIVIALVLILWLVCHIRTAWILGLLANLVWRPLSQKLEADVWRKLTGKSE